MYIYVQLVGLMKTVQGLGTHFNQDIEALRRIQANIKMGLKKINNLTKKLRRMHLAEDKISPGKPKRQYMPNHLDTK